MSIRLRLAVMFSIATAIVFFIAGYIFVVETNNSINSSVDASLIRRAPFVVHMLLTHQFDDNHLAYFPTRTLPSGGYGPPIGQFLETNGKEVTVVNSIGIVGSHPLLSLQQMTKAATGQLFANVSISSLHGEARLLANPVTSDIYSQGYSHGVAVVGISLGTGPVTERRILDGILLLLAPVALLAGLAAWILAKFALRPVEIMRAQADMISSHDSSTRLPVPKTKDEISALGHTMNDLLERLQSALAAQKSFISDASHEIRTPIAILQTELELANRPGRTIEDLRESLHNALDESKRVSRIARDLLLLASSDEHRLVVDKRPVDVGRIVKEAVVAVQNRSEVKNKDIQLHDDISPDAVNLTVLADPDLVRRAVDNLIDNALRFAPGGSLLVADVHSNGNEVVVAITDQGAGFPPDFLPHAFDRFARPDGGRARNDGGTGLGLAIVQSIVEAHSGWARAENLVPIGARVSIGFPTQPT
ncbi:MAG: HAMP domain-containing histidine kinase [Actinobacteria bacterium]|nr:HAMP domain-containing histidine kinase [Actinomycetota bacterium]